MSSFLVHIKDGSICFRSPYQSDKFFKEAEGKYAELTILESPRSISQNNLYWHYLKVICEDTGNEDEEALHELLKQKLLPRRLVRVKGRNGEHEVEKVQSTTKLSKSEFAEYLLKIERFTGTPIPDMVAAGYLPS